MFYKCYIGFIFCDCGDVVFVVVVVVEIVGVCIDVFDKFGIVWVEFVCGVVSLVFFVVIDSLK